MSSTSVFLPVVIFFNSVGDLVAKRGASAESAAGPPRNVGIVSAATMSCRKSSSV